MSLARRLVRRASGAGIRPRDGGLLTAWRLARDGSAEEEVVEIEPAEGAAIRRTPASLPEGPRPAGQQVEAATEEPVPADPLSKGRVAAPSDPDLPATRAPAPEARRFARSDSVAAAEAPSRATSPLSPSPNPAAASTVMPATAGAPPGAPQDDAFPPAEPLARPELDRPPDSLREPPDGAEPGLEAPAAVTKVVAPPAASLPSLDKGADAQGYVAGETPPQMALLLEPSRERHSRHRESHPLTAASDPRPKVVIERVDVLVEAPPPPPAQVQSAAERARAGARYLTWL